MASTMRLIALCLLWATVSGFPTAARAQQPVELSGEGDRLTIVVREASIAEVFEMLSRKERINILIGHGVEGSVSVSLFDVTPDRAIRAIADAAGYVAERRRGSYVIIPRDEAGRDAASGNTIIRAFKIQYSHPEKVSQIVTKHLSRYGEVTVLDDRKMIVVEDLPDFIGRIERLLAEIDREPRQVLIEARVLIITLNDNETFGIDWTKFFSYDDGSGLFGVRGLSTPGSAGLFFELVTPNIDVALTALSEDGRVRALLNPTLFALENQEAEVLIADRLGYRVTTTINEVTTESVEFLESGVILRLTASVDRDDRILLNIHPEVSNGIVIDGLPNQTTTEVTTKLLVEDGQSVFIGGLLNDRATDSESGMPFVRKIPILGHLVSSREAITSATETVVVVTAHLVDWQGRSQEISEQKLRQLPEVERQLRERVEAIDEEFEPTPAAPDPTAGP